jgi:hypothetical protein
MEMINISGDMYYVKAEYRNQFLQTIEIGNLDWSGTNQWNKYPKFLRYRKCDFSGEKFKLDDQVFCVYVVKFK